MPQGGAGAPQMNTGGMPGGNNVLPGQHMNQPGAPAGQMSVADLFKKNRGRHMHLTLLLHADMCLYSGNDRVSSLVLPDLPFDSFIFPTQTTCLRLYYMYFILLWNYILIIFLLTVLTLLNQQS